MPFVELEGKLVNIANITYIERSTVPASQSKVKSYVWLTNGTTLKFISLTVDDIALRIAMTERAYLNPGVD